MGTRLKKSVGGDKGMSKADYLSISKATLLRLPAYLRFLYGKKARGGKNVSASEIAGAMGFNPVQVRKDIAEVSSVAGRPKTGFDVCLLVRDLERFLGFDNSTEAVLAGVGKLGKALLGYGGFADYGLKIVAGFDSDTKVTGTTVNGKLVLPISKLPSVIRRINVHIGIIAVTAESAQEVCDAMVAAGIRAIWNFAPIHLTVPESVVVKNEDMAASLALLSRQLSEKAGG